MIKETKLPLSPDAAELASKATIIGNCGAIVGGTLAGYISQYLGRRLTIIMFVVMTGALIPAWILPNSFSGLAAGAFFIREFSVFKSTPIQTSDCLLPLRLSRGQKKHLNLSRRSEDFVSDPTSQLFHSFPCLLAEFGVQGAWVSLKGEPN